MEQETKSINNKPDKDRNHQLSEKFNSFYYAHPNLVIYGFIHWLDLEIDLELSCNLTFSIIYFPAL